MKISKIDLTRLVFGLPLLFANSLFIIILGGMAFGHKLNKPGSTLSFILFVILEIALVYLTWKPIHKWIASGKSKMPVHENNLMYASLPQRLLSGFIDIFLFSFLVIVHYLPKHYTISDLVVFKLLDLIYYPYLLIMVSWRGQTIGKILVGIKIYKVNGENVSVSNSFWRSVIDLSYYIMFSIGYGISIWRLSQPMIDGLSYGQISKLLLENNPFRRVSLVFSIVWISSEYVTMLLNKEKRAIHDYLGGTIVLSKKSPN